MNKQPAEPVTRIASWTHTAIITLILLAIAVRGAMFQSGPANDVSAPRNLLALYTSLIAAELVLLYATWRGIKKSGTTLASLTSGRWDNVVDVLRDIVIAALLWGVIKLGAAAWDSWIPGLGNARSIDQLLPTKPVEIAVWIPVSIVAAVVEELVFRGYFQRQFTAATQSKWIALALQSLLFGVSHGYQGVAACARITIIGALFGAVALWRRSLLPGMIAHAWTDIASGALRL